MRVVVELIGRDVERPNTGIGGTWDISILGTSCVVINDSLGLDAARDFVVIAFLKG